MKDVILLVEFLAVLASVRPLLLLVFSSMLLC